MSEQFNHQASIDEYRQGPYIADDDAVSVVSLVEEEEVDLSVDHYAVLREEAVSAQRLSIMRNTAEYVKGCMEVVEFDPSRPWTNEKMFRVSNLLEWKVGEPKEIVKMMHHERVRARVSADMGTGKSTYLPFYVADEMDHRVLYVSPDAVAMSRTNAYVRNRGTGKFRRNWCVEKQAWVCCMTYADFCGYGSAKKRAELYKHFETIIFDEGSLNSPSVKAALKTFAVLATATTNLLICSANVKVDGGLDATSAGQGKVRVLTQYMAPEAAMATGKLVEDYLTDRTLVVLPSDERVHDMATYYEGEGVDAQTLDSAADEQAVENAEAWLRGDSSTPRVLVVHTRFLLAYNLPVSFVILWPVLADWEVKGNKVTYVERPMPQTLVNQGMARAGRGIVEGAGGIVMGSERGPEDYVSLVNKLEEFVRLCANYIKPLRNKYWEECYAIFPNGLAPETAHQLRKVNLPVVVASRFLAEDGMFAAKYIRGLMLFSQTDHYVRPLEKDMPAAYDSWVEEPVFGSNGDERIRVPMHVPGEMQIVLQTIVAVSEGKFDMGRWRLPVRMNYRDNLQRIGQGPDVKKIQRSRLRRVRSFEAPPPPVPPKAIDRGWTYETRMLNQELGGARTRSGKVLPKDRFKEAVQQMREVVSDYVEQAGPMEMRETQVGTVGEIELPAGVVESPGGTTICELPGRACSALNAGLPLNFQGFCDLLDIYRQHRERVVASRLFDCFSSPWTSLCTTLLDDNVVAQVVRTGLASQAYEMFGMLSSRFAMELISVVKHSHVYRKRYLKFFTRDPTVTEMMAAIRAGQFTGIAQSDNFLRRVVQLKSWIDQVLVKAEVHCVYLPYQITDAQRTLPIHQRTLLGDVHSSRLAAPLAYRDEDNPMSPSYVHRRKESW